MGPCKHLDTCEYDVTASHLMQQAQSSPRTNFEKMRGHAGSLVDRAINLILEAVNVGNFLENEAKDFAGKFHENAGGRFIHTSSQGNFKFDE